MASKIGCVCACSRATLVLGFTQAMADAGGQSNSAEGSPNSVFSELKGSLCSKGNTMVLPGITKKPNILARECYEHLFDDILDLASLGFLFVLVSGNPGIGKSCFLWYVLVRLLNEQDKAVIVQLVEEKQTTTYVFTPQGTVEEVASAELSPYYKRKGTWLLTDQKYVGHRASEGVTVLFASPKKANWDEARRVMNERWFTRLFMPPWSVEELQAAFFNVNPRLPRFYREFWVRYYIAGSIARWYFIKLHEAFAELSEALENIVKHGVVDATLFKGGMDNGLHSHKIFCAWPSVDYSTVSHYSFISEWAEHSFAIACYGGRMAGWMKGIQDLADDSKLRSAAGTLFERYAHYRLSKGGIFPSTDDPSVQLVLARRNVHFFDGNTLPQDIRSSYLRQNSSSFPVLDSVYPPNVMFQMSIAKKRKAMKKSVYDNLCLKLATYIVRNPAAASGVQGAPNTELWPVLVKMRGDNSTQAEGLTLVEECGEGLEPQTPTPSRKRQRCVSSVKQHAEVKKKKTLVKFQMTIVLGEDELEAVDYNLKLHDVCNAVYNRMVDDDDPMHLEQQNVHNLEGPINLLMRKGRCELQYQEFEEGVCVFGVWITASRTQSNAGVYETVVDMKCTTGTFLDEARELKVFINERLGVELQYDFPIVLCVARGVKAGVNDSGDNVTASLLDDESAKVEITSKTRDCKYFCLCVGSPGSDNQAKSLSVSPMYTELADDFSEKLALEKLPASMED